MNKVSVTRSIALVGYFGLMLVLMNWFLWIAPPTQVPRSLLLIALVIPLLFPLRGLVHGNRYTYQWACFLSMFYFIIGVDVWFNRVGTEALMGALTVLFSILFCIGTMYYSKFTGTGKKKRRTANHD